MRYENISVYPLRFSACAAVCDFASEAENIAASDGESKRGSFVGDLGRAHCKAQINCG